jgi:triosephosphate isomerase
LVERKPLIAGNWKMNGSREESRALVLALLAGVESTPAAEMVVCPPFVYLESVRAWLADGPIVLGAQDVADQPGFGAFTGEVSGRMLVDMGCRYVIVGHSERRALYGETDAVVARKFAAAGQAGLRPILCLGETLAEREAGRTLEVVRRQLEAVLGTVGLDGFSGAVVAYEPVWAIGTGRTASPEQAEEVHAALRQMLAARSGTIAATTPILYGGSMKGSNAAALLRMEDIDGGLVGGASLNAAEFLEIWRAALSKPGQ